MFEEIDSISQELAKLLNSTDKNENKIFTNITAESHIISYYNRVVGYRNTERGISMLHSTVTLLIKKMLALRTKKTVKISTQINRSDGLTSEVSNPLHASAS